MRQILAALVMILIMVSGTWTIDFFLPIVPTQGVEQVIATPDMRILNTLTDKDVDCLAKNVYYEARGEETIGQFAVAEVTLNRWKRQATKSLCQIVYQRSDNGCQFSWVCNPYLLPPSHHSEAWRASMAVATAFVNGRTCKCDLQDAMFFHAVYVKPHWAKQKPVIKQIGKHIFYADNNLRQ